MLRSCSSRPLRWMLAALVTLSPSAAGVTLRGLLVPTLERGVQGPAFELGLPLSGREQVARLVPIGKNQDKDPPACVATPYEAPGQGWIATLSSGGVTRLATSYGAQPPDFKLIFGLDSRQVTTGNAQVRVFVVDRFDPIDVKLNETGSVETWPLQHGNLVLAHMLSVLRSGGYTVSVPQPGQLQAKRGGSVITLRKIELPDDRNLAQPVSTGTLVSLLNKYGDTGANQPAIYNMSFAVVSCEYLTHYRSVRDAYAAQDLKYTLNDHVADTARANNLSEGEVLRLITELPPTDPLRRWLEQVPQRKVVVVASSGNYGLPVQTWPAEAPTVIGVGASAWTPRSQHTGWSDVGDTYSVGEWFRLGATELKRACQTWKVCVTDELKLASVPARYNDFGYRGTSFAAPSVTAFLAMRLSASGAGKGCFKAAGTGFVPVVKLDPAKATPIDQQGKPFTAAGLNINRACP